MSDIFLARQPIYDRNLRVYAYELLYRAGECESANVVDGDDATSQVLINALMEIGLPEIVGRAYAFVNMTKRYILQGLPTSLAEDNVVLEVLEDIVPDEPVVAALQNLKSAGFTIALDDFVYEPAKRPLVAVADIIKIDLMALDDGGLEDMVRELRGLDVRLLAEKVETRAEFEQCMALGFDYFQGYFFCKPDLVKGRHTPSCRLAITQLLARLQDPDLDFAELQTLIAQDVSLSYRILRYINSAHFNLGRKVDSIQSAVCLLGLRTIRTWVIILAMSSVDDKPYELILTALIRAHMCEALARTVELSAENAFTAGLFSALDAFIDQPLDIVIASLPLSDELNDALLQHTGELGRLLHLVLDYERGHWDTVHASSFDAGTLRDVYLSSIRHAGEISDSLVARR